MRDAKVIRKYMADNNITLYGECTSVEEALWCVRGGAYWDSYIYDISTEENPGTEEDPWVVLVVESRFKGLLEALENEGFVETARAEEDYFSSCSMDASAEYEEGYTAEYTEEMKRQQILEYDEYWRNRASDEEQAQNDEVK